MPKWSQEDTDWLMENRTKGIDYCARHLGRTYVAVSSRLNAFGVVSNKRRGNEVPVAKVYSSEATRCYLPPFHPVMMAIDPTSMRTGGGNSPLWRKRRALILKMHDYMCVYCGDEANTVDHVVPMNKGGMDNIENLVAACAKCNYGFGDKTKHVVFINSYPQKLSTGNN